MLDSSDIRCLVLSFRWWFMELFFVCADLLRWVPIFLRTVYSAQFCLHRCGSSPMLSRVFKMLSVDWYVRNRIKHVHPVSDGNSRCRLGAARHSTTSRVLPAQSASRVTVRHGMNVPDSLYLSLDCFLNSFFGQTSKKTSMVSITGPLCGETTCGRWIPLTKEPVMRKTFDVMKTSCNSALVAYLPCRSHSCPLPVPRTY